VPRTRRPIDQWARAPTVGHMSDNHGPLRPDPTNRARTVAVRRADAPSPDPDNGAPHTGRLSRPAGQPGDRRRLPRWWAFAAAALLAVGAVVWGPGLYSNFRHPAPAAATRAPAPQPAAPTTKPAPVTTKPVVVPPPRVYGIPIVSVMACPAGKISPPGFTVSLDGAVVATGLWGFFGDSITPAAGVRLGVRHRESALLTPRADRGEFVLAKDPGHAYRWAAVWGDNPC